MGYPCYLVWRSPGKASNKWHIFHPYSLLSTRIFLVGSVEPLQNVIEVCERGIAAKRDRSLWSFSERAVNKRRNEMMGSCHGSLKLSTRRVMRSYHGSFEISVLPWTPWIHLFKVHGKAMVINTYAHSKKSGLLTWAQLISCNCSWIARRVSQKHRWLAIIEMILGLLELQEMIPF